MFRIQFSKEIRILIRLKLIETFISEMLNLLLGTGRNCKLVIYLYDCYIYLYNCYLPL